MRGDDQAAKLSIGALARATGVQAETIRTWESRYGFPTPERRPSGHRLYSLDDVGRLKRIARAIAAGHRPGQVVGASDEALAQLLGPEDRGGAAPSASIGSVAPEELLELVRRSDANRLTRSLLAEWARRSPLSFAEQVIAPLLQLAGEAWANGTLDIHHEHFMSERLGDLLRALRLRLEESARGPTIALASLPGESHGLGLQMAALVLAAAGCRVLLFGTEVPLGELPELMKETRAFALGISISAANGGSKQLAQVRRLRERLGGRTPLLLGGAGAPGKVRGTLVLGTLGELDRWARQRLTALT